MRAKVDPEVMGNAISKMKRTKNGELLIVINGSNDSAYRVNAEFSKLFGADVKVRKLDDLVAMEIRDLNAEIPKEELVAAVSNSNDDIGAKLVSLRSTYGKSKIAVLLISSALAKHLCGLGWLRVSLVYTRVRPVELPPRSVR